MDNQRPAIRAPRQERARHKVGLILEAAIRLLDRGGLDQLNTNAVAETAGVSVGTLYQYFPNKEAILEALADREIGALSERILAVLGDPSALPPQERVARVIRAVASSFGERRHVHRLIIGYSLARGGGLRVLALIERIIALLTSQDRPAVATPMNAAEAFVLTNAFVGVMRAMIMRPDASAPAQAEIEEAMGRLVVGFMENRRA